MNLGSAATATAHEKFTAHETALLTTAEDEADAPVSAAIGVEGMSWCSDEWNVRGACFSLNNYIILTSFFVFNRCSYARSAQHVVCHSHI